MRLALTRTLIGTMIAMTALAALAGAADQPTAEEQAAIDYVTKLGGQASVDQKLPAEARVLAKFEAISDTVLVGLKKYPKVGGLDTFDASRCTDKGMAALKELPHLHKLVLSKVPLTPAGATALGRCKELRHLVVMNAGVTDAELASLSSLTMLEHLTLSGNPKITDKGMLTVKGFDRLRVLHLGNTSITDAGLMELKVLDGLRTLTVNGTKVTQDAAEKFADQMPNLRAVRQ
jgi:hypothetical protein